MTENRTLATKIFEHLEHLMKKGAELGNVSITLIEEVLDKELPGAQSILKTYEYTGQDVSVIIQAENQDHAHKLLQEKLGEEDVEFEDVGVDELVDITSTEQEAIAFIDNRSAFH